MEATTLDDSSRPTEGERLQETLLTITDDVSWRWQRPKQLRPIGATFIRYPQPGNDKLGRARNEADLATNPDAVDYDRMVNLAGQYVWRWHIPAPGGLVAEGTRCTRQFVLRGLAKEPGDEALEEKTTAEI